MKDIGFIYSGLKSKNKNDFINGNKKYVTYKNIYMNRAILLDIEDYVVIKENEIQNKVKFGDMLVTGSSENKEEAGLVSVVNRFINEDIYLNSFCFGFRFNEDVNINIDYIKHLFSTLDIRRKIENTANGVTRFNVSREKFMKINIPIPPLEVQEYIASILNEFDTIINSINVGLPCEIELTQKQYEYYREQLLDFNDF